MEEAAGETAATSSERSYRASALERLILCIIRELYWKNRNYDRPLRQRLYTEGTVSFSTTSIEFEVSRRQVDHIV